MTQFLPHRDRTVACPVCDDLMFLVKEIDQRVAVMQHPVSEACSASRNLYRIDRISGYGESYGSSQSTEVSVPSPRSAGVGT